MCEGGGGGGLPFFLWPQRSPDHSLVFIDGNRWYLLRDAQVTSHIITASHHPHSVCGHPLLNTPYTPNPPPPQGSHRLCIFLSHDFSLTVSRFSMALYSNIAFTFCRKAVNADFFLQLTNLLILAKNKRTLCNMHGAKFFQIP